MECKRCHGLMMFERFRDGEESIIFQKFRCVSCGDLIDDIILKNREISFKMMAKGQSQEPEMERSDIPLEKNTVDAAIRENHYATVAWLARNFKKSDKTVADFLRRSKMKVPFKSVIEATVQFLIDNPGVEDRDIRAVTAARPMTIKHCGKVAAKKLSILSSSKKRKSR